MNLKTSIIEQLYKVAQKYIPSKDVYPLGYREFDKALDGGLRDGELITISASSGEGKTTFCQNLTVNFHKQSVPTLGSLMSKILIIWEKTLKN